LDLGGAFGFGVALGLVRAFCLGVAFGFAFGVSFTTLGDLDLGGALGLPFGVFLTTLRSLGDLGVFGIFGDTCNAVVFAVLLILRELAAIIFADRLKIFSIKGFRFLHVLSLSFFMILYLYYINIFNNILYDVI